MTSFPQRILRASTAFSLTSTRVKHPRVTNRNHISFIKTLPCIVCLTRRNIEAAHVKMGNPLYGKSEGGTLRPNDVFTVSLCAAHHDEQHSMNEAEFWKALDIDPLKLALALFDSTGDEERAEAIIRSHRGSR